MTDMQYRRLGRSGLKVSLLSFGSWVTFANANQIETAKQAAECLSAAKDAGVNFFDNAEAYSAGESERVMGEAFRELGWKRHEYVVSTKLYWGLFDVPNMRFTLNRKYLSQAIDGSLERFGLDFVDLVFCHRPDPKTPIEETVGAMAELVRAGKVRHLGLSEASAATIRRAHKTHPIAALQTEYSLWSRDPEENEILATTRELGIAFVAYSPLGRGFLTGQIKSPDDFAADDFRRNSPRFRGDNFKKNLDVVKRIEEIAAEKKCTAGQLALAWLYAQGEDMIPIPGTRRRKYLEENVAALEVKLSAEDLRRIDEAAPRGVAAGQRYSEQAMKIVNG